MKIPAPTMPPMTIIVASKSPRRRAKPRAEESGNAPADCVLFVAGKLMSDSAHRRVNSKVYFARTVLYHFHCVERADIVRRIFLRK